MFLPSRVSWPAWVGASRTHRLAVYAGMALFWVLLMGAALVQPGYDSARDSISSLASHGAALPWIGMLALVLAAFGILGAGLLLRRISDPAALTLGLAGLALLVVAVTRITCPMGAAECAMSDATPDMTSRWHWLGSALYEMAILAATACASLCLWRAGRRTFATWLLIGIAASLLLFAGLPIEFGLRQRANMLVHTALIAGLISASLRHSPLHRGRVVSPGRTGIVSGPVARHHAG